MTLRSVILEMDNVAGTLPPSLPTSWTQPIPLRARVRWMRARRGISTDAKT
jgi:hypothetical protein